MFQAFHLILMTLCEVGALVLFPLHKRGAWVWGWSALLTATLLISGRAVLWAQGITPEPMISTTRPHEVVPNKLPEVAVVSDSNFFVPVPG